MSTQGLFRGPPARRTAPNRLPGQRPPWIPKREIEVGKALQEQLEDAAKGNPPPDIMLYRNTSDTYREHVPGDLYVSRAPHQVRPFSHTGVAYDLNAPNGIRLSLNEAVQIPEYEQSSVRFRSAHQVCLLCRDMLNYYCKYRENRSSWDHERKSFEEQGEHSGFPLPNAVVHHFNLLSMLAFVEIDECFLCSYVWQKICRGFDIPADQLEEFRIECCWTQKEPEPTEGDTIYFVMYNPSLEKEWVWNYRHLLRLRLWPKDVFGHFFERNVDYEDLDDGFIENISDDDFACNDKPITRALARTWYEDCKTNEDGKHNGCNKQHDGFLPTRLLDVQHAIKTSQLRLVCSKPRTTLSATTLYATLSHCWGTWGASMNPVLSTNNLEQRQETGLDFSSVPQTFLDAVAVAHWFDIEWLWIDCLCIVQDSKEDWMREARMMDRVYRNAELNISSDFGEDSRSGLFVNREYTDVSPLRIEATKPQKILYATPEEITFRWMREARSLTRAWIHRERQLARRILHFTSEELVWECCGVEKSSFASESFPGGAPFEELFDGDTKFQSGRLHEGDEEMYGVWNDLCERLSNKNVTHGTDMPIILSSLAKEFHPLFSDDEYLAGLWKSTLPYGLLWRTNSYGVDKHKIYADNHDHSYIAPSWSWLSVSVPVTLALKVPSSRNIPVATVLHAETRLSYDDPYGPVQFGALHLEGIVRQIQIDFNDEGRTFELNVVDEELRADGSERLRYIGSNWREYEGEMCNLELDSRPEAFRLRCYCLFTTITERGQDLYLNERNLSCLLIRSVNDGDGVVPDDRRISVYKRIGILTLKDLYSLKIRYAVDDGSEEKGNAEETANVIDGASRTDDGEADDSGTEREHQPMMVVDGQEVHTADDVVTVDLELRLCAPASTATVSRSSSASETQRLRQPSPDEPRRAQDSEGDRCEEGTRSNDQTEKVGSSDDERQSDSDTNDEDDPDTWDVHAFVIKRARWRVIEAAEEEEKRVKKGAVKLDRTEQAEEEQPKIDSDVHPTVEIIEHTRATIGDRESEGISRGQTEHSVPGQTEAVDGATTELDAAERSDHSEDSTKNQERADVRDTQSANSPDHAEVAEDDSVLGLEEDETWGYDYSAVKSATPAWGQALSPLEALYQFDDVLDTIRTDTGQFKWMKRLQTTKITIV